MDSLARSLCEYLLSRNNDISGYYGVGMLCNMAKRDRKPWFGFKIKPGQPILISGCLVTWSNAVTEKLAKFELDSIDGRMQFYRDGHYPDGSERFHCVIAISITQDGRTGLGVSSATCRPHDPSRERRRSGFDRRDPTWFEKLHERFQRDK